MATARTYPEFSTAGFYQINDTGRDVFDFKPDWRFLKGDADGAEAVDYDDATWEEVNLPHGLELLPAEASGSVNYQGPAWYRKRFRIPDKGAGKKVFLHFEAIMGKSRIWINGRLVAEHFGGFLPIHIDMTAHVDTNRENVIAVRADNSDDPEYPPGKPQEHLDWTYFGGIYRDVWLIATNDIYITNAHTADKVAGGGIFVHTAELNDSNATVKISVDMANDSSEDSTCIVENTIAGANGETIAQASSEWTIAAAGSGVAEQAIVIEQPRLWTPEAPSLYDLRTLVKRPDGTVVDGYRTRIGIRTIDFRGRDGFYLNGKPYEGKLIGGNRHQDFAYVGNALPNSMHYRDARRLRDAGMKIIRSAHYPLDPAFMDACDELGLFVIVATPGWQFFSERQVFQDRVCSDIRNMVRRDRNRPCVLIWECILNEVGVTEDFARRVHDVTHQEYPYPGCFTAADEGRDEMNRGIYDVMYAGYSKEFDGEKPRFQREWGDHVDDFYAHNSPSRVSRDWGEAAQLVQALHYANAEYPHPCWDTLCDTPRQFVGGCLWHSFDHQRGYHPDPFWGGITDAFRQSKYSYYMFLSQRDPADSEPMVFVANEMTPFSGSDVWVFTNCEEIRLSVFGEVFGTKAPATGKPGMTHPPVCFENVYSFSQLKARGDGRWREQVMLAEGLINGKVVAAFERVPSRRKNRIRLRLDDCGVPLMADGGDFTTVIAEVVDDEGVVKRLNKDRIRFEVKGEGEIMGDHRIDANPRRVEWGSAPVLIRSTRRAGPITVKARLEHPGITTPDATELTFASVAADKPAV